MRATRDRARYTVQYSFVLRSVGQNTTLDLLALGGVGRADCWKPIQPAQVVYLLFSCYISDLGEVRMILARHSHMQRRPCWYPYILSRPNWKRSILLRLTAGSGRKASSVFPSTLLSATAQRYFPRPPLWQQWSRPLNQIFHHSKRFGDVTITGIKCFSTGKRRRLDMNPSAHSSFIRGARHGIQRSTATVLRHLIVPA